MPNKKPLTIAFIAWVIITLLVIANILFIGLRFGTQGFQRFIQEGVFTHLPTTLASISITWLLAGSFLYLLFAQRINKGNAFTWIGFYLVAFLYVNVLRERYRFGDISYYIDAATRLANNQPLPDTHFYMPLWASLIKFLLPLGDDGILMVLGSLNLLSVFAFYFLLQRVLEHYGFTPRLSAIVTTLFMLVNTPLIRTLMFVQVNLHVMNAIFLSLLLYRKHPFFSALMLALAAHLKTSPLILVLAFLLEWDWRWMGWFALSNLLVVSITLVSDGISPFIDVLNNLTGLASHPNLVFHNNAFDAFFGFPADVFAFNKSLVQVLVYGSKGLLGLATLFVLSKMVREQTFFSGQGRGVRLFNAIPALFILMNMASPVIWVHHGIFLSLSFLILIKRLSTTGQWLWFGLAYLLEFVIPTFNFYPWSYGRLFAPLICLGLMWNLSGKPSELFARLNNWFKTPSEKFDKPPDFLK